MGLCAISGKPSATSGTTGSADRLISNARRLVEFHVCSAQDAQHDDESDAASDDESHAASDDGSDAASDDESDASFANNRASGAALVIRRSSRGGRSATTFD